MDMPPTRYRVVERGRRLIVIDSTSGRGVSSPSPLPLAGGAGLDPGRRRLGIAPPAIPSTSSRSTQARRFGLRRPLATPDSFVTQSWFDTKAPRAIKLNYSTRARLDTLRMGGAIAIAGMVALSFLLWPWFPVLVLAGLTSQKMRSQLRKASTYWLDGFDQAG